MSFIEDFIYDDPEFYTGEWLIEHRLSLAKKGKWETKDEGIVAIKDMTKSHIENVIRMLNRSRFKDDYFDLIQKLEHELLMREKEQEDRT